MRQRVSESAGFVSKDAQEKRSLSDVIRRWVADQGFEPGLFTGIILESIRLLEGLGRCFLIGLVVGQHCFIVLGGFRQFFGTVMNAGQQVSSVDAKNRIREMRQHAELAPSRQTILEEKTRI